MLYDLISLFFPRTCAGCSYSLFRDEQVLCMKCRFHLPSTGFELDPDNVVARAFWGRVELKYAAAGFAFRKGNIVQKLVHRLKYRGDQALGEYMGRLLGHKLEGQEAMSGIDLIMPVPLHPRKLRKRGFNQSECLARGLSDVLHIPLDVRNLQRSSFTATQTKRTRYARWENVSSVFQLRDTKSLTGKHILLVDDVITTGATLEAAAACLLQGGAASVSVAAFASTLQ